MKITSLHELCVWFVNTHHDYITNGYPSKVVEPVMSARRVISRVKDWMDCHPESTLIECSDWDELRLHISQYVSKNHKPLQYSDRFNRNYTRRWNEVKEREHMLGHDVAYYIPNDWFLRTPNDDTFGVYRETLRLLMNEYETLSFPGFDIDIPDAALAHRSVKDDTGKVVAYTQSYEKLQKDVQTPMKVGRFLKLLMPDAEDHYIRDATAAFRAATDGDLVKFTSNCYRDYGYDNEEDMIEWVYQHGPRSCMVFRNGMDGEDLPEAMFSEGNRQFRGHCHPARVYAGPDTTVAFISKKTASGETVTARSVVVPDEKIYVRCYGDEALHSWFKENDYRLGNLGGQRIRLIPDENHSNGVIMPYLDDKVDDGDFTNFTVDWDERVCHICYESDDAIYCGQECSGVVHVQEQHSCTHCGNHYVEDDMQYIDHDQYAGWVCDRCVDQHFTTAVVNEDWDTGLVECSDVTDVMMNDGSSRAIHDDLLEELAVWSDLRSEYIEREAAVEDPVTGQFFLRDYDECVLVGFASRDEEYLSLRFVPKDTIMQVADGGIDDYTYALVLGNGIGDVDTVMSLIVEADDDDDLDDIAEDLGIEHCLIPFDVLVVKAEELIETLVFDWVGTHSSYDKPADMLRIPQFPASDIARVGFCMAAKLPKTGLDTSVISVVNHVLNTRVYDCKTNAVARCLQDARNEHMTVPTRSKLVSDALNQVLAGGVAPSNLSQLLDHEAPIEVHGTTLTGPITEQTFEELTQCAV